MLEPLTQFWERLLLPLTRGVVFLVGLGYGFLIAYGVLILTLVLIALMLRERRQPSNIFAWSLLMLLLPFVGVPLYLLFGGRKSRGMVRRKRAFFHDALQLTQPDADLESFARSVRGGNQCAMLGDGTETFHTLIKEIRSARHSIHILTFILSSDRVVGSTLMAALSERASAGVRVRLLVDGLGSITNRSKDLRRFQAAGGELSRFMPLLPLHTSHSANLRNHRKMAIFDGDVAITGGQNLDPRFIYPHPHPQLFTDFSLRISGPVVQAMNFAFLSDWSYSTGAAPEAFLENFQYRPQPAGDSNIEVIESGPEINGDPLYERFLMEIQECEHDIILVTPYFVPDEVIQRSLIIKSHRGRRIRLILPRRSNHRMVDMARYRFLRELDAAGVEILFYTKAMLHAKLFIVDNKVAITGSANCDMRSLFVNFEIGLVHTSPQDIALLTGWYTALLPDCVPFGDILDRHPRWPRRAAEDIAHLVSPLL